MPAFTKKPVTIEAMRFETNNDDGSHMSLLCDWANEPKDKAVVTHDGTSIFIATLEGTMRAEVGDWIIRGVKGELYPCKPDIFEATYAQAKDAGLSFGEAVERLRVGERVARAGWNGKGMWLSLVTTWNGNVGPAPEQYGLLPFICMRTVQADFVPWLASQTDILAADWCVVA